jgi:hypothetical protein
MTASEEHSMAAKKSKSILRTAADIGKAWRQLESEIAKHRADGKEKREAYAAMTRAEFEAKLKTISRSPCSSATGMRSRATISF